MFLVDRMIVGGIRFVLDKVATSVDHELNDDTRLREELMAAQMRVELGEMSQEEFAALEDVVLERIREIRARRGEGGPIEMTGASGDGDASSRSLGASDIASIEASFVADDVHGDLTGDGVVDGEVAATVDAAPAPHPHAASTEATASPRRKATKQRRTPPRRPSAKRPRRK